MTKALQVPYGWKEKRASSLFQIQGGFAFKSTDSTENGARWLKIANIGLGNIKWDEKSYLPENFLHLYHNFCLNSGDIVVAMTRPLLSGVLKIAQLLEDDSPCLLNQRVGRLIPKEGVSQDFLFHILKTRHLAYKLESDLLGTDPPNLSIKTFTNIKILLPPLPEQKAIADLLSTWDEAIEKVGRLIHAKEASLKGQVQKMISQRCGSWSHVKPKKMFDTITEKNFPEEELLSVTQDRGVIPRSMLEGRVMSPDGTTASYKLIKQGDFAISLRSFQGGIEYSNYQGIISPAYTVLRPKMELNIDFYRLFFKTYIFIEKYLNLAVIGIRDGKQISIPDFLNIKIPVPPLEEQKQIAETLSVCQHEIDLLKQLAEKYKTQKRGLMQRLLTGDWRIKGDVVKTFEDAK